MKYFILFYCFFKVGVLIAQEVKVSVMSDGIPLEYANLFINNRFYGASNVDGFINIRESAISDGDTISVSFVGMETGITIFKPNNYDSERIIITLIPNLFLDEIVVLGEDRSEEMFRRYVKDRHTLFFYTQYQGDYSVILNNNKETRGSFVFTAYPEKYANYWKLDYLKLIPDNNTDTIAVSSRIKKSILNIILTSISTVRTKNIYIETKEMKIKYMGKDNGCYVFSLIKPIPTNNAIKKDGFQTIIYSDQKSHEIVSAETILLLSDGTIFDFSAKYTMLRAGLLPVIHPYRMEGSVSDEHNKIHFLIENITVNRHNRKPRIPKKDR